MDWSKGFSARYYMTVVDRNSWRDIDRIEITGGSVRRSLTDLRESADINCIEYDSTSEQIIRVWLDAKQGSDSSHTPIFTGLATSPGRDINGRLETNTVQCYSILKIAQDILLPGGWYAPAEADSGSLIRNLLSVTGAPISISENSPGLKMAIISEQGENNLSMVDKILNAINWRLRLTGLGEIIIEPISKESVSLFSAIDNDVLELSLSVTYDWYNCPNVFRAISGDSVAIARDDSIDSPLSTINRGREIWTEEINCYLNENETLAEYARRALKDLQKVAYEVSYTRRFDPDVRVSDVVTISYPEQNIFGNFLVTDQNIDLSYGGSTSEEAVKI